MAKDTFTPVYRSLAQEVGLVCAAVYGVVSRYCQMQEGACRASLKTLGDDISVDRATVMRSIEKLCDLGYLIDTTPGLRNVPHTYILGKSVAECNSVESEPEGKSVVIRNSSDHQTVAYNNSSIPTVAQNNTSVAECNATVAESHLNIDSKRLSKIESSSLQEEGDKSPPIKKQKPATIPAVQVFVEVTGRHILNNTQIKAIDQRIGRDPPALEKWREVITAWQLRGYKINNIDGMLEWFKKGIPVYQNGANSGTNQKSNKPGIKALERTGESLRQERTIDIYTREYGYPDGHREPIPPVS